MLFKKKDKSGRKKSVKTRIIQFVVVLIGGPIVVFGGAFIIIHLAVPAEHRGMMWERFKSALPVVKNFSTVQYDTDLLILDSRSVSMVTTAYTAIDTYLSVSNQAGDRYIAIIPTHIAAGFDFTDSGPGNSLDTVMLPAPQIISVSSGSDSSNDGMIRDGIQNMSFDTYIKPLRMAIEDYARNLAVEGGILSQAQMQFSEWYNNLFASVYEDTDPPSLVFAEAQDTLSTHVLERFPLTIRLHGDSPVTVTENPGSLFLAYANSTNMDGRFTVFPDQAVSASALSDRLRKQLPDDDTATMIARVVNPLDHSQGGVVVSNSGTGTVHAYQLANRHIVGGIFRADNLEIAGNTLGNGIYSLMASSVHDSSVQDDSYLNAIRQFRSLSSYIHNHNWDTVIALLDSMGQAGLQDDFEVLGSLVQEFSHQIDTADLAVESPFNQLFHLYSQLTENDYATILSHWETYERTISQVFGGDSAAVNSFHGMILELNQGRDLLSADALDRIRRRLIDSSGRSIDGYLWRTADSRSRKRMLHNYFHLREDDLWYIRSGLEFTPVNQDQSTAINTTRLWWHRAFVGDDPHSSFESESNILGALSTNEKIRALIENEEPVLLVVPSSNVIGEKLRVLLITDSELFQLNPSYRSLFQESLSVDIQVQINLLDSGAQTIRLRNHSQSDFPEISNLVQHLLGQIRQPRTSADFGQIVSDILVRLMNDQLQTWFFLGANNPK